MIMSRMAEGKGGQEKERKKREKKREELSVGARRPTRLSYSPRRSTGPHMASMCVVWRRPGCPPRRLHSLVHASLSRTRAARNAAAPSKRPSETDQPGRIPSLAPSLQWSHLFILFSPPFLDKKNIAFRFLLYTYTVYT